MLAQTLCAFAILGGEGEEVEGGEDGGESDESKAEGVTLDVPWSIAGHEAKGSDSPTQVAKGDLESGTNVAPQVPTYY